MSRRLHEVVAHEILKSVGIDVVPSRLALLMRNLDGVSAVCRLLTELGFSPAQVLQGHPASAAASLAVESLCEAEWFVGNRQLAFDSIYTALASHDNSLWERVRASLHEAVLLHDLVQSQDDDRFVPLGRRRFLLMLEHSWCVLGAVRLRTIRKAIGSGSRLALALVRSDLGVRRMRRQVHW